MFDLENYVKVISQEKSANGTYVNNRARIYFSTPYYDRSVEVFPNIYADDVTHLKLLDHMQQVFDRTFKIADVKDGYLGGSRIPGNFQQLLQIAGYPMNPLSSVPRSQKVEADDPSFIDMIGKVTRLCSGFEPTGVPIRRVSSSGLPDMSNDLDVKMNKLVNSLNTLPTIVKCSDNFLKKQDPMIFLENGYHPFFTEVRRYQHTDKVSRDDQSQTKLRSVSDWTGKTVTVDREIKFLKSNKRQAGKQFYSNLSTFKRTRSRLAYAGPGWLNYPTQYIATGWRNYYSKRFAFTFKHINEKLFDKTNKFRFIIGLDVANFDWNISRQAMHTMIDNITFINDEFRTIMRTFMDMPMIIKNDYLGQKGTKLVNPLTDNFSYGNPSGWAFVSDAAKMMGCAIYFTILSRFYNITGNDMENILRGLHGRFGVLNMGDDMVAMFSLENDAKLFEAEMVKGVSPFSITREERITFLGVLFDKENKQTLPDLRNMIVKIHVPERGIGGSQRPFFSFGFRVRLEYYSKHPLYREVYDVWNRAVIKFYGKELMDLVPLNDMPLTNLKAFNLADMLFLENPDVIHYKVNVSDVDKDLYDVVFITVPMDKFKQMHRFVN